MCSPLRRKRRGQAPQDMPIRLIRMRLSTKDSPWFTRAIRLKTLTQALERIQHGNLGECAECGGDIEPKRLEAIPWARYCVKCQEAREQG